VAGGERVIDPRLAVPAVEVPANPLSPRESEILQHYADGRDPADIAAAAMAAPASPAPSPYATPILAGSIRHRNAAGNTQANRAATATWPSSTSTPFRASRLTGGRVTCPL
jgi:hypothetical protein